MGYYSVVQSVIMSLMMLENSCNAQSAKTDSISLLTRLTWPHFCHQISPFALETVQKLIMHMWTILLQGSASTAEGTASPAIWNSGAKIAQLV